MLHSKIALVTGASRGIGEEIALELARQGADVIVNYSGDHEGAKKVVAAIEGMGRKAVAIKANVSNKESVEGMMKEIKEKFGKLDLLVNNAGITRDRTLKNMTQQEWDDVIATNLSGVYQVSKQALTLMPLGSSMVNISSVVGLGGNFGQSNYASAKAGILGFTKSLAREIGKKNIRVNAIAPGFIETKMTQKIPFFKKFMAKQIIALKRMGSCNDVASLCVFLLSDESSYITGQTIRVDGGMML